MVVRLPVVYFFRIGNRNAYVSWRDDQLARFDDRVVVACRKRHRRVVLQSSVYIIRSRMQGLLAAAR